MLTCTHERAHNTHTCARALLLQARQRAAAAEAELQRAVPAAESRARAAEKRAAEAQAALERAERRLAMANRELEVRQKLI